MKRITNEDKQTKPRVYRHLQILCACTVQYTFSILHICKYQNTLSREFIYYTHIYTRTMPQHLQAHENTLFNQHILKPTDYLTIYIEMGMLRDWDITQVKMSKR